MSLDRPGAGGDERDDEFTEVLDPCLREPRRAAPAPTAGHDRRSRLRRRDRAAAPRRPGVLQRASRGATANGGRAWPACCRLKGHDGQNGTRVAGRPGIG